MTAIIGQSLTKPEQNFNIGLPATVALQLALLVANAPPTSQSCATYWSDRGTYSGVKLPV